VCIERDDGDGEGAIRERITIRSKADGVVVLAVATIADRIIRTALHHQRRQHARRVLPGRGCLDHGFEGRSTQLIDRALDIHRDAALLPARAASPGRS
jgi:hypothetical protein